MSEPVKRLFALIQEQENALQIKVRDAIHILPIVHSPLVQWKLQCGILEINLNFNAS